MFSDIILQKVSSLVLALKGWRCPNKQQSTIPALHISHFAEQIPSNTYGAIYVQVPIFSRSLIFLPLTSLESPKSISRISITVLQFDSNLLTIKMLSSLISRWMICWLCIQASALANCRNMTCACWGVTMWFLRNLVRDPPSQYYVTIQQLELQQKTQQILMM